MDYTYNLLQTMTREEMYDPGDLTEEEAAEIFSKENQDKLAGWLNVKPGSTFIIPPYYFGVIMNENKQYKIESISGRDFHKLFSNDDDSITLYPGVYCYLPNCETIGILKTLDENKKDPDLFG